MVKRCFALQLAGRNYCRHILLPRAPGDFSGMIHAWMVEQAGPAHSARINSMVRCLTWLSDTHLLVGCLQGVLYLWDVREKNEV